jgi:signal transduction histidine kinase/CheY-like chemotaxis protein
MLSEFDEIQRNQKRLIFGFTMISTILALVMMAIAFIGKQTYFLFAVAIFICSIIDLFLYSLKKYQLAALFLILSYNFIILHRVILIHSTLLVSMLIPIMLYSFIVVEHKWGTFIFFIDIIVLVVAGVLGLFLFTESIDPYSGLYLTNSLVTPLVSLIASYFASLLIYNILAGSLQKLREQNLQLKNAQDYLIRQDRSEQINILAGGIAHDFNNLLAASLGNIELMKFELEEGSQDIGKYIEKAELALLRARNLTKQLLLFSKNQSQIFKKPVNFNDLLHKVAEFTLSGTSTIVQYDISENLWLASCDESQISQVIQNLVLNASQAMDGKGNIIIRAHNKKIVSRDENSVPSGEYIEIKVQDEGPGIPKENIHKIFAPYFTTKASGTGLGLAVSYNIIKNHQGFIDLSSSPQGTIFTITIPADSSCIISECDQKLIKLPKFHGNILILEDDATIQETLKEILQRLGFSVTIAENGPKAITLFKLALSSTASFDYLFLDLTIRGSEGGVDVFKALRKIDPNIKAIISSGYSPELKDLDLMKEGFVGKLDKPYTIEEVINLMRSLSSTEK